MTTGPAHYREAERLADIAYRSDFEPAMVTAAVAQVHATLALAAATALDAVNMPADDLTAWIQAASEAPAANRRRREALKAEAEEFLAEHRGVIRDTREVSTAAWFRAARANGCTATAFDTDTDSILHEDPGPCPVHPGLPDLPEPHDTLREMREP